MKTQEARLGEHLRKRLSKREQPQSDSARDADVNASLQTANNSNIHFQCHNRGFIGNSFLKIYIFFKNIVDDINKYFD